jgi:uncharacterized CHY-type Zn-finger protein
MGIFILTFILVGALYWIFKDTKENKKPKKKMGKRNTKKNVVICLYCRNEIEIKEHVRECQNCNRKINQKY